MWGSVGEAWLTSVVPALEVVLVDQSTGDDAFRVRLRLDRRLVKIVAGVIVFDGFGAHNALLKVDSMPIGVGGMW